jgi:HicA-like toxin of HicAB toxin-antitoxin system
MMARHARTLRAIFREPTLGSIKWSDIEALLKHQGATIAEGEGSRVRVELKGQRAVFHRPHPQKESKKYQVEDVRRFLANAGIRP